MILTTTNSIEGSEIESYHGPISSHVVFGANLFSDIAASFRDVFGGRSASYQNQLKRLTEAALQELKKEAKGVKGNAIVGVKLDYSEMSGGGKSGMFMVVATGTAVTLSENAGMAQSESQTDIIDGETIQYLADKAALIAKFKNHPENPLLMTKDLINSRCHELWEDWKQEVKRRNSTAFENPGKAWRLMTEMVAQERGHEWILSEAINSESSLVRKQLCEYLKEDDSFQLADLTMPLKVANKQQRAAIFDLVTIHQSFYRSADIEDIRVLKHLIAQTPVTYKKEKVKKALTGKIKTVNRCECGGEMWSNEGVVLYCDKCRKNPWGMNPDRPNPAQIAQHLNALIQTLEKQFSS
jgi:uncharacterized protein YbjQ (UPF0145 family)